MGNTPDPPKPSSGETGSKPEPPITPTHRRISTDDDDDGAAKPVGPGGATSPPSSLSDRVRTLFEEGETKAGAGAGAGHGPPIPPQAPPTQIEVVPTTFKWTHGGNEVFVTGSFNDWKGKILMHREHEGGREFSLVVDIPPGVHMYKYIVDDQWRLDPDAPQCVNGGVVNNTVEVKRPVFEDTRAAEAGAALADSDDDLDENKQKISYGQKVPSADDYTKDPLKIPPHLSQILLNSPPVSVDPYVLPIPGSHVTLNHLYVYSGASTDAGVMVTGITQRFKLKAFASLTPKFVTTVYYCPRPGATPAAGSSAGPASS